MFIEWKFLFYKCQILKMFLSHVEHQMRRHYNS